MNQNNLGFWRIVPIQLLEEVRQLGVQQRIAPGTNLFQEGEPYRGFYLVEAGAVKVYNVSESGKEAIMNIFRDGDAIASILLLTKAGQYPSSAQALEFTTVQFFDAEPFKKYVLSKPEFLFEFSSFSVRYAMRLRQRLSQLILSDAKERIKNFFDELGAHDQFVSIPIPKNQLASLMGITPEALSRSLKALEVDGFLAHENGEYKLL